MNKIETCTLETGRSPQALYANLPPLREISVSERSPGYGVHVSPNPAKGISMGKGWVLLHRKIEDHFLWFAEPFTKAQAWIDLFLFANHTETTKMIKGQKKVIKRGQVAWSEAFMAKRWRWSRNKVRRFLFVLESEQMVEQQKDRATSVITIICYDDHQKTIQQTEQQTIQQTGHNTKNYKQLKELKEKIDMSFLEAYKIYPGTKSKTRDFDRMKKHCDWKECLSKLKPAIEAEIEHKDKLTRLGHFCPDWKNFSTWINQRCWEQELPEVLPKKTPEEIRTEKLIEDLKNA